MRELSIDEIAGLAKVPDAPPKTRKSKGTTVDDSDRTVTTWFKLNHRFAPCSNDKCEDPREVTRDGLNVVATVNAKDMCRYCFLSGYGSTLDSGAGVG